MSVTVKYALNDFKGELTNRDSIDNQITNGVDFFPNDNASGFTPKTDLESLYKKVQTGGFSSTWPEAAVSNEKTRNAYGSQNEYFVPNGIGLSHPSHVITGDNILGVKVQPQFTSDFMTTPIASYNSRFSLSTPLGAGTETLVVRKEAFRYTDDSKVDVFQSPFKVDTLKKTYDNNSYIEDLFDFKFGDFKNVPAGINANGKVVTKKFKEVADPFNFDLFRQPFMLRETGNQWGMDRIPADGPFSAILGGFVRGAPGITGLISRSITDKIRIGKFLLTNKGIGFIAKQYASQALNPTLESKVYNPLSALSITGTQELFSALSDSIFSSRTSASVLQGIGSGLADAAITAAFPIGHPERHLGGGRYEDIVPLRTIPNFIKDRLDGTTKSIADSLNFGEPNTGFGSRLAMQSNPKIIPEVTIDLGIFGSSTVGGADLGTSMIFMNPNKYLFPISSAPKKVHKGIPSFVGTIADAKTDAELIESKPGGTFNKETSKSRPDAILIKKHSTLSYENLMEERSYFKGGRFDERDSDSVGFGKKATDSLVSANLGNQSRNSTGDIYINPFLSVVKGDTKTDNVDKVNMIPYGSLPRDNTKPPQEVTDFIKFKFHDIVNKKWIIFRAILEGISDSVTPEYGEERYIGRPDKVYTYQGVDRSISFGFSIYPKTKQELPILMEKLNYLVGLCYPTFTKEERMITPFIDLTLGDMFRNAPGILSSLTVTVEDTTTWEIDEGLQFPHFIKAQCEFKYIGKYSPSSKSKHYDIYWNNATGLSDNRYGTDDLGFNDYPSRAEGAKSAEAKLYEQLGQN